MKNTQILKSMLILALALVCVAALLSCGETAAPATEAGEPAVTEAASATAKEYNIGISQFVTHEALDAATNGFMDALKAELGDDVKVNFDVQNAAADSATCSTIANAFVAKNVDLIMANATPALQAAFNATTTIPILGTSVTEYGVALGISDFTGTVGGNVSGTSDCAPLAEQAAMILELFPDAKNVGMLYCSAEPNSEYQVKVVESELSAKGINVVRYSFADSNDVASVTTKAAADSDVVYIPTDNTAASCAETIGNIVKGAKTPVVAGESGICAACGVATLSISYYDLGSATGKMAAKILTGQADISTMPIEYAPAKKMYNPEICTELGITVPADYEAMN